MDSPRQQLATTVRATLAAAVIALAAIYACFVLTAPGQRLDAELLVSIASATATSGLAPAMGVLRVGLPLLGGGIATALAVLAIRRGRWQMVVFAAAGVAGATLMSVALRTWLPRPDHGAFIYPYNTLPSGHVVAFASSCVAIWVIWPTAVPAWLYPASGGAVLLSGLASVGTFAHRPSDVLGAPFVVAAVFSGLALVFERLGWPLLGDAPTPA